MGRHARINYPDLMYHVINRGNNKQVIFRDREDYLHYLNTIQRYKKKYRFKLFAYCLMPNHVHLLIKVSKGGSISKIMQSITVAQTRRFNDKYQRCGHVWQGRFLSPLVSSDEYAVNVMRYIEQNPWRAGMVAAVADYPFSSYKLNISKKSGRMIDREDNDVYQAMGKNDDERIKQYKRILNTKLGKEKTRKIQVTTRKGHSYISEKFAHQFAGLLPNHRKRGRPRRAETLFSAPGIGARR